MFGCLGPGTPRTVSPSATKPKDFCKIDLTLLLFQLILIQDFSHIILMKVETNTISPYLQNLKRLDQVFGG